MDAYHLTCLNFVTVVTASRLNTLSLVLIESVLGTMKFEISLQAYSLRFVMMFVSSQTYNQSQMII